MKILIYGVGEIGKLFTKYAIERGYEITGAVDIDPNKIGKDLGQVVGVERLGIIITDNLENACRVKPEIAIHATSSWLDKCYNQIESIVKKGINVLSTCETLSYPYYRYRELAEKLHSEALRNNVTVSAAGINPGFLMDLLPSVLVMPCIEISKICITRSVNALKRRVSFQRKIGLGLKPEEFYEKLSKGLITGHVGYAESACLLASSICLEVGKIIEKQEPIVRDGTVCGIEGTCTLYDVNEVERITLKFLAGIDFEDYDEVKIIGLPEMYWRSSGVSGDYGTVGVLLNLASKIIMAKPGLRTVIDLLELKLNVKIK